MRTVKGAQPERVAVLIASIDRLSKAGGSRCWLQKLGMCGPCIWSIQAYLKQSSSERLRARTRLSHRPDASKA